MFRLFMTLAAFGIAATPATPAMASGRVALVIGNGEYGSLTDLANPPRDAAAMAGILRANGFKVMERRNLDRADFLDALDDFSGLAKGAELALVYYAGHGMDIDGRDVLAPIDMEVACPGVPETMLDASADDAGDVAADPAVSVVGGRSSVRRAVDLDALIAAADGAAGRIVLLDACRSDPFPLCAGRGAEASGFRGLSRVGGNVPTMIVNATLFGHTAADGRPGGHSPFTGALIARMRDGGTTPFRDLFDAVAGDVRIATNGAQVPEVTSRGGAPQTCLAGEGCGSMMVSARLLPPAPRPIAAPLEHGVGKSFRDRPDGPEMVVVPAGDFMFGSPEGEPGRDASEGPVRPVTIAAPFAIARTETTVDEYAACVLEGGCPRPARETGWSGGTRPVVYVDAQAAAAYAAWLTATTGRRYRLPTEAEWEYAARAGTTTAYSTGEVIPAGGANVDLSLEGGVIAVSAAAQRTDPVGSYPPNPFGLHDMHGNVAEWTADCWSPDHAGAPGDGSPRGGDCTRRVVKGGSWYFEPAAARSAARTSHPFDQGLNVVGFRVVREL